MKHGCPYCSHEDSIISSTDKDLIIRSKLKTSKTSQKWPFVRIIHSGEGWRDARIIEFDEKNLLTRLAEVANLSRFDPMYYDREKEGWVTLTKDSSFPFLDKLKDDVPLRGLEIKLVDNSILNVSLRRSCADGFFGYALIYKITYSLESSITIR